MTTEPTEPTAVFTRSLSKNERKELLRAWLVDLHETAQILDELRQSPDENDKALVDQIDWDLVPPISARARAVSAYPVQSFAVAAMSQGYAASQVRCQAPPTYPKLCDLILSQTTMPHYRCHHDPAHCYDMSGAPIRPCP